MRFFCKPNEIGERLPRHMIWHRVARELLGLPPAQPPYPDYISSPLAWDPKLVRQMLAQVEATTGRLWPTAIAGQLHFSECVLYGVFVDDVMGAPANSFVSDDSLCLVHWEHTPLNLDSMENFIRRIRPTDIAAVIQSKSLTPPAVREAIFAGSQGCAKYRPQRRSAGRRSLNLDAAASVSSCRPQDATPGRSERLLSSSDLVGSRVIGVPQLGPLGIDSEPWRPVCPCAGRRAGRSGGSA